MAENLNFNQESILKMLHLYLSNATEERNLALDRFRRQDETIDSNDVFFTIGKTLSEYLKIASDRTDAIMNITKLITSVVFKNELSGQAETNNMSGIDLKKEILKQLQDIDSASDLSEKPKKSNDKEIKE